MRIVESTLRHASGAAVPVDVSSITATLPERSREIDAARRLPADLVDELRATGCLRLMTPRDYGGADLPFPTALNAVEELARADAATGFVVGQVVLAQMMFRCFPRAAVDDIYRDGPNVFGGGSTAPVGRARRTPAGWKVSGRWPFVTGCGHADWLYLNCVAVDQRRVSVDDSGLPVTRMVLVPARAVTVVDTWDALGLRGTGSSDVAVSGFVCADDHTYALGSEEAERAATDSLALGGLLIGAVAIGIASAAVDDIAGLAGSGKRPTFSREPLRKSTVFLDRLGEAHVALRGARALLYREAEAACEAAFARRTRDAKDGAALRAVPAYVTTTAVAAVDAAHALAGGSAVYERSPLPRRVRDAYTVRQHFAAGRTFYESVGAALVGGRD